MKKTAILIPALSLGLLASLATACHDDDGNYSYTDLDRIEVTGGDTPLPEALALSRGERLQIDPAVIYNGRRVDDTDPTVPLRYTWTFYIASTAAGLDYTVDTLATTRAIDVPVNRVGGSYWAQLTVTHTATGIESYYRVPVQVEEAITAGWMVLYERADRPGTSDVGLVVNPYTKKNVVNDKEFWNLYSASNGGEPLAGTPVNIFHETAPLPTGGSPRIATSRQVVAVNTATFEKVLDYDEMFYDGTPQQEIRWYGPTQRNAMSELLITGTNTAQRMESTLMSDAVSWGFPLSSEGVGHLAPWGAQQCIGGWSGMKGVVYDEDNSAFYYCLDGLDLYSFPAQDPAAAKWDVNDTQGARLLYGDWGTGWHDFMLMERGGAYYVAEANFSAAPGLPNIGSTWADVSDAPGIDRASAFATNYIGRYALYGTGGDIYSLTYDNGRATKVWSAPSPTEQVVCVATQKYHTLSIFLSMMPSINTVLHIATWDEAAGQGKLYQVGINPASGAVMPMQPQYEYTVPGRVKAMAWKYEMAS